jgi:hypothetical protein
MALIGQTTDDRLARGGDGPTMDRRSSIGPEQGESEMATFMDIHNGFVGVTRQQLLEAHQRDLELQGEEGVSYERAWLDPESGKVFCLATGPSKEAVMRVHERAGHPTPEIYELPIEV